MQAQSTSHSIKLIPVVAAYAATHEGIAEPVVVQHFIPARGWKRHGWRKRISLSYARSLKNEGVTTVGLDMGNGRIADFRIDELLRTYRPPISRPTR